VNYPVIEAASETIQSLRLVARSEYTRLSLEERRHVFSLPGIENVQTLAILKGILAECFERGDDFKQFTRKVVQALGRTVAPAADDLERVFRAHANRAYIDGLLKTMAHPVVSGGFPYLMFSAIADERTPATHLALEHFGLNGTAIYRIDDPFWKRFMPPLTDLCRCGVVQLTICHAAEYGVKEAEEWLRTGQPPQRPAWVQLPHFDPRLELEDEGPESPQTPEEVLKDILALRAHLIQGRQKACSDVREAPLPRDELRAPTTPEEGLALLEGRIQPEFTLPPLDDYFEAMEWMGIENLPPRKGEPENDLEYLETIDAITACCKQAVGRG
jgi:hypothetical protein